MSDLPIPPHVSPPLKLTLSLHAIEMPENEMSFHYRPEANQNIDVTQENRDTSISHTTSDHAYLANQATSQSYSSPRDRVREKAHGSISPATSLTGHTNLPARATNRCNGSPRSRNTEKSHSMISHTTPSTDRHDIANHATGRSLSSPRGRIREKSHSIISPVTSLTGHSDLPVPATNRSYTSPRSRIAEKSHNMISRARSSPHHVDHPVSQTNGNFINPQIHVRELSNSSISRNTSFQGHSLPALANNHIYASARSRDHENSLSSISHATLSPDHSDQLTSGANRVVDNIQTSSSSLNNSATPATVSSVVSGGLLAQLYIFTWVISLEWVNQHNVWKPYWIIVIILMYVPGFKDLLNMSIFIAARRIIY